MGRPIDGAPSVDWSIIFDTIANEYGYDWERFTSLTYKQLDAFLEAIDKRRYSDFRSRIILHGGRDPGPYIKKQPVKESDLADAKAQMNEILKRKQIEANLKNA
jgi:hypothetical protein